ncbi:putative Fe-Mo cluster-binding NifX family protein [Lutibacter oceani]|uniref:Putative Fe-Mo cluster-binding NifX family protein n=1 Tax=Lutibacter oceani TaxID=1853311 RepID=A0A3D9RQC5_9FLAO|nr:NifB/NifX family molybdenum-iron cluster-binding protein [Lutibacter oceani]REE81668.1 putative Fe-Mo cluster-binding NifX family protein [Lutibacter oceani]
MKTIVAVTFQNKKTIFEHAGKCRNYLIYTIKDAVIESKKLLELTKEETLHSFFHDENNLKNNILLEVDIILTKGIGNGAIDKLARYGVICYKIEESDPDIAINKLINGTLEALSPVSHKRSGCNCNCGEKHFHYN